ncbi:UPF0061 protein [Sparassis crispa]|uniref:Selenoprotein O n=1 Tax=Sparassis crispa TaxID=139825 RepID=A0A401H036_9APHY|nr:UPF0061 protein [Sparassis crispa]GBE87796.1 UPF0061 protein [Sparassis crispa]
MLQTKTYPISALPLPPSTHILTRNLTPDPQTPSVSSFYDTLSRTPSLQRKARLLAPPAHFSLVVPCPQPFPYRIPLPENGEPIADRAAYVEKWLADREALHERPTAASPTRGLRKFYREKKAQPRVLIGLSETGLRDCVPHLKVGDVFATLGSPSLTRASTDPNPETAKPSSASEEDTAAREELIDVLSGYAVLLSTDGDPETHWAPWSLRYSGHQFGVWAGQLGDGRAISVLSTPHPSDPDLIYELQLKGAGRTPFSRNGDGLAVVRSSIREYLCSEAMHALSIPTTRSLSLISLPELPVARERMESACVLTRMAPSFIRIGSFEALNPPEGTSVFGIGQQDTHWEGLRALGEWVVRRVLKLEGLQWKGEGVEHGDPWGTKLVLEVARRNAKMVAAWQAYGFMHGVINTDNVSVLGLTIDYGPFAFMDVFDPFHICNHTDDEGRYSYKLQPSMIIYALRALLTALSPIIGAEAELGRAVSAGWAEDASPDKLAEWRKKGTELVKDEMERVAQDICSAEYGRLMHKRLALRRFDATDELRLARPLLNLMSEHELDFHSTFRRLAFFRPTMAEGSSDSATGPALGEYISGILSSTSEPQRLNRDKAVSDWRAWLESYAARIESERDEWIAASPDANGANGAIERDLDKEREKAALVANPRFVLRQWVLEEVIKKVEEDAESGKRILAKVMQMCCSPFEPWGAESFEGDVDTLDAEIKEERRYCGVGDRTFLGFQCSCSS